jgi:hypothetical protein
MNGAIPGSSADPPSRQNDATNAGADAQEDDDRAAARSRSHSRTRKTKAGLAKKLLFMTDLMTNLDMLVFAELCVLYYME